MCYILSKSVDNKPFKEIVSIDLYLIYLKDTYDLIEKNFPKPNNDENTESENNQEE